jgi:hypothetical protein
LNENAVLYTYVSMYACVKSKKWSISNAIWEWQCIEKPPDKKLKGIFTG